MAVGAKHNICIIAPPKLPAVGRLQEEVSYFGGSSRVIQPDEVSAELDGRVPILSHRGRRLACDGILHIMSTDYPAGLAMLGSIGRLVPYLNKPDAVLLSANKFLAATKFRANGLSCPRATLVTSDAELVIAAHSYTYPLILKQPDGSQGKEVALVGDRGQLLAEATAIRARGRTLIVQECITESLGRDLRIVVVGGKVVAAMERLAAPGEFRANMHLGAAAQPALITKQEARIALQTAHVIGLDVVGVDMMRTKYGPVVIETNSFPGLEYIEQCTGINVARPIVQLLLGKIRRRTGRLWHHT
jgi:ribosomal protein S6--L-glutamate ligase